MSKSENFFEHNDRKIYFKIILKNKKNISIKVDTNGEVFVFSPYGIRYEYINNLVKNNATWIIKQINKKNEKSLFEENKLFYKGNIYNVVVNVQDIESINLKDDFIIVNSKSSDKSYIYELINQWYKKNAMELLPLRVDSISRSLGLIPSKILIKNQKTLWGSCNSKKVIRLNWRLILMKESVMDYIIIHELCHIVHMNHSKAFWALVEKYDPNYKDNKLWLKEKGSMLMKVR